MRSIARLVFVLAAFSLAAGLLLAFTQRITSAPIRAARANETLTAIAAVLPPFDNRPSETRAKIADEGREWVFLVARKENRYAGCAFECPPAKGYGGPIRIMVGLNADDSVRDVRILEQTETPGLGTKVASTNFLGQFVGHKPAEPDFRLQKDGGRMDAVTGATISSRAVVEAVRAALAVFAAHRAAIVVTGETGAE